MTSAPLTTDQASDSRHASSFLRVSRFDEVTSFLAALILLIGSLVFVLGLLWVFAERDSDVELKSPPRLTWSSPSPQGITPEFLLPGVEETTDIQEQSMQEVVLAVTDAASEVAGSRFFSLASQTNFSPSSGGPGDSRPPGPISDFAVVSRAERWQLMFSASQIKAYAKQLDHFEIEIGLIGGAVVGVDYASDLSSAVPKLRRGASDAERRLYFLWTQPNPLREFDLQLLRRGRFASGSLAGHSATIGQRHMLKLIPSGLENELAKLELQYAAEHGVSSVERIAKTVFTSKSTSDGYQFFVTQQRYKKTH
ncbi:MAG: hypothetical protein AB8B91_24560 [Rubripirellula sp.]